MHTTEVTSNPSLLKESGTHNHLPDAIGNENRETLNMIKESARTTSDAPNLLIARHTATISNACKGSLPLKQNIKRCIRNVRSLEGGSLNNPHRREDIHLPESFTTYNGQSFLLHDSGPINDRVMIFGTEKNLDFLKTCDVWMFDGTFKSSPVLFDQIFVIHGYRNGNAYPLIYCLTPNRTTATYQSIFRKLKAINPNLAPTVIMSDFEKASRNAFHDDETRSINS